MLLIFHIQTKESSSGKMSKEKKIYKLSMVGSLNKDARFIFFVPLAKQYIKAAAILFQNKFDFL